MRTAKTCLFLLLLLMIVAFPASGQTGWKVKTKGDIQTFNANDNGNQLTVGWANGNAGNTWDEGEWLSVYVKLTSVDLLNTTNATFTPIQIQFDFTKGGARFIDLVRGMQVGTVALGATHGWPQETGSVGQPYPVTTRAELEIAQKSPGVNGSAEPVWYQGTANTWYKLDIDTSQINRDAAGNYGAVDDGFHYFSVTRQDIMNALPTASHGASTVYLYFALHLSQTFIWSNSLQSALALSGSFPEDWGGYLYGVSPFDTDSRNGSAYVSGSSGQVRIATAAGQKTSQLPIPPAPNGTLSGSKWYDHNEDDIRGGFPDQPLPGWNIYVSTTIGGIPISRDTLTDASGNWQFTGLPVADYLIYEIEEGPDNSYGAPYNAQPLVDAVSQTPPNWGQTFPNTPIISPPPSPLPTNPYQVNAPSGFGYAPVGYIASLTATTTSVSGMDFNNTIPAPICAITGLENPFCRGNTATFTVSRTGYGRPPYTYSWSGPNNFSSTSQTVSVVASDLTDGTYTATITDVNGKSSFCTADLNLYPQPPCGVTGPGNLCEGTSAGYSGPGANSAPGVTIQSWDWAVISGTATLSANSGQNITVTAGIYNAATNPSFTLQLTTTSTDGCIEVCQYTVVIDPIISCPADLTVQCASNVPAPDVSTVTQNCGGQATITHAGDVISNQTGPNCYTITRTYQAVTATLTVYCDQIITVNDDTDPTITQVATDLTVECDGQGNTQDLANWLANYGGATATDNCTSAQNLVWTYSPNPAVPSDDCGETGSVTVTFRATDECGNFAETTATFTIEDTTPPTMTTQASAGSAECQGTDPNANTAYIAWLASHGGAAATDVCSSTITWSDDRATATWTGTCTKTITIIFTASDECQNGTPTTATFTITDTTPPDITTQASAGSSECQGTNPNNNTDYIAWLANNGGAAAADLCGNGVTWSHNAATQQWSGTCTKTITITFTATDDCQNSTTTTAMFTIDDTTPPDISPQASNGSSECQGTNPNNNTDYIAWLASNGGAAATDLCGNGVTWTNNAATQQWSGTCVQTIDITFTATDNCQNSATTTATFTINDTTPPNITTQATSGSAECQGTDPNNNTAYIAWLAAHANAVASDLCGNGVTWTNNAATQQWSGTCTKTIDITFTATDNCQNGATTTATFTINDTTPPDITTQASAGSSECQGTNPNNNTDYIAWLADHGGGRASDLCGNNVTWTHNAATQQWSGTCTKTITITFTATDDCQNSATTTATFTINDTTPPDISPAASAANSECQGTNPNNNTDYIAWLADNGGARATDLCGNGVTWTHNAATQQWSGTCVKTIDITFTATDNCQNSATTTATFTINDTTPPDITTQASAGSSECQGTVPNNNTDYIAWLADNGGGRASDLCGNGVTWTNNAATQQWSGTCVKIITITFTATDNCQNSATTTATFTINDTTPPNITTQASAGSSECQGTNPNNNTDYIAWLADNGGGRASDLCGNGVTWTHNAATQQWSGTCTKTITITFTATDDCQNSATTTATFTINDTTPPDINPSASAGSSECQGLNPNNNTDYIAWLADNGGARATDLCGNGVTWTHNAATQQWSGTCTKTITITFTATDDCQNSATTTATFTINDTTPPDISPAASAASSECQGTNPNNNTDYIAWLADNGGARATDLCGNGVTWTHNAATQQWTGTCVKTIDITFTATDNCQNSATTTATFTINDTTPPDITTQASAGSSECQGTNPNNNTDYIAWLANQGGAVAADLCGNGVTWTHNAATQQWSGTCTKTITITFTATDDCQNSATTSATFTINDTTPPAISPQASNASAECQGTNPNANTFYVAWLADNGGARATDLCGNGVTWTHNAATQQWSGTCVKTITITFTATDDCQNSATTSATFTINDTTPPDITTQASAASSECQGTNPNNNTDYIAWLANYGGAVASDLCGNGVTWTNNTATQQWSGTCTKTITITFTATDNCQNSATTTATFTIYDTTPPDITTQASNGSSECQGTNPNNNTDYIAWLANYGGAVASDLCGNGVTWTNNTATQQWSGTCTKTITITFTATDDCQNSATTTATFTINDTTPPDITTQASAGSSECQGTNPNNNTDYIAWLANYGGSVASDLCGNGVTWTNNTATQQWSGTCTKTITITFTATDDCQNSATTTATFTINDTTPPDITTQASAGSSECQGTNPNNNTDYVAWLANYGGAVASDLCGNGVTWTNNTATQQWSGTCTKTITITFTATDDCQNSATTTATFTINDTTPPNITTQASGSSAECQGTNPNNNTVYQAWLANNGGAVASDLCGNGVTWSNDALRQSWTGTCTKTITITFTATDDCQNSATTSASFIIYDTTPPDITTQASNSSAECQGTNPDNNTAYMAWLLTYGGAIASDLCGNGATWSDNSATQPWTGTCSKSKTVTFTVTDNCQNSATTSATFTIVDTTPPTITCPPPVSVTCASSIPPSDFAGGSASDLCTANVTVTHVSDVTSNYTGFNCYTLTRTYRATDDCNNSADCQQIITVNDNVAPYWITSPPSNVSVLCRTSPIPFWNPQYGTDYDDNCSPAPTLEIVINHDIVLQPDGSKLHTRSWRVVDACNNVSTTVSQTILEARCNYATLTKGFYGNQGGTYCGTGQAAPALISSLMQQYGTMVVGILNSGSLTFLVSDSLCIIGYLPGGSTPSVLTTDYSFIQQIPPRCAITPSGLPLQNNGQFSNNLLCQTITYALNMRLDPQLTSLPLPAPTQPYLWTYATDYVNGVCLDGNDVQTGLPQSFYIPPAVLTAMGSNGSNKDLLDLLDFANNALAGNSIYPATLTEVTMALDAFNSGFDKARYFAGYHAAPPPKSVVRPSVPQDFALHQNHPNPFNPATTITFTLPVECEVYLSIFNALGEEIAVLVDRMVPAGTHAVAWNIRNMAIDLPSGVYTYRIHANGIDDQEFHDVKKMMLVK